MDKKLLSNFLWRFFERSGYQIVTFLVSVILARLIDPEAYGIVAIITVFTTLLQVFIDSGFGSALVQKYDTDNLDYSTVFFFNIVACLILYLLIYFSAPAIAIIYNSDELILELRVTSILIIISSFKNVQVAYISRKMLFKKTFFSTIVGTVVGGICGIVLAIKGFGVWALIVQLLISNCVDTTILWIIVPWRPQLIFSFSRLKGLFSFGWKLLASRLLDTGYLKLRDLIIGKMFNLANLAYYNRGEQLANVGAGSINNAIDSIMFPTLSQAQKNTNRVKEITRRGLIVSSYVMIPMMVGLACCAEPFIRLVFTEKWMGSVPFLRIACFSYAFMPVNTVNLNAINAIGRSDLFLKLEIIKKSISFLALIVCSQFGIYVVAFSAIPISIMNQMINAFPNKKLLNYTYLEQIKDILPSIIVSLLMGIVVYFEKYLFTNDVLLLVIQVVSGIAVYVFFSIAFKVDAFIYLYSTVKNIKGAK